jgi:hypothetical protein
MSCAPSFPYADAKQELFALHYALSSGRKPAGTPATLENYTHVVLWRDDSPRGNGKLHPALFTAEADARQWFAYLYIQATRRMQALDASLMYHLASFCQGARAPPRPTTRHWEQGLWGAMLSTRAQYEDLLRARADTKAHTL